MSLSIQLSTRNFAEASKVIGNDEFHFVIGDKKLSCHKFIAAFLSHSISQILLSDPTIDSFHINIGNQMNSEEKLQKEEKIQSNLNHLITGEGIDIKKEEIQEFISELDKLNKNSQISDLSPSNISSLLLLSQALQNDEIIDEIYRQLFSILIPSSSKIQEDENLEQKIFRIQKVEKFPNLIEKQQLNKNDNNIIEYANKYLNKEYNEIVDDIASHFDEINEKYVYEMNEFLLNSILSSQKLQVENEDTLLSILLNRRKYLLSDESIQIEKNCSFFIEKVEFEYLSEKSVNRFFDEMELHDINLDIWSQIKKRLVLPVQIKESENKRHRNHPKISFKFDHSNPFNGIFKHLTNVSNGNIVDNGTIEIKSSNLSCGKYNTLVDFQNENGHTHVNEKPTWIQIDFKARKCQINSYLIKSSHTRVDSHAVFYLKSWKVEVSLDGSKWEAVDERKNVSELNGNFKMHTFNLDKLTVPFRFIRIFTDQGNWCNNDSGFSIGKLELFGNIIE